ncbi:MAG TPA: TonB-dependent receptor [Bacteroidetes bacterium]|nr:TonB-dependent receptor [Bacteroidota bacterium]
MNSTTKMSRLVLAVVLFALWGFANTGRAAFLSFANGGKRGRLQGTVLDAQSREPLPGANILLKGTTMGTISDAEGRFRLEGIPAGRYTIVVSVIGYQPGVFRDVRILPNQTTSIRAELRQTAISAPEIIVTASKSLQRVQDSPISVAVIPETQIRQTNSVTVQDVLRFTPGLYTTADQINIRGSTGYSKGAGSRVLVLLDGVPAIAGDTGGINWDAIPPTEIEKIEVVKGAGSALYGSNALGGVINIITRDPSPVPKTRLRFSWGFYDKPYFDSWRYTARLRNFHSLDVSHSRTAGKLGMLLMFGQRKSTGYHQNGQYRRYNLFGKFHYRFSSESHLNLLIDWGYDDHGNFLTWKGPALNHPLEVPPESLGDSIHSGKFIFHATYKTMLRNNLALILKSSLYHNNWRDYFHDNNDYAKTYKTQQEFQFLFEPGKRHSMTFGGEWVYHQTHSSLFSNPYMLDLAAYVQDVFQLSDKLRITVGGRFDRHRVMRLFTEQQFSPKFGLVYHPAPAAALRLSVGKGFRAASIAEIFTNTLVSGFKVVPNLNLRAESVWSFEIGWHQMLPARVMLDVALFQNRYRNMIEPKLASFIPPAFKLDNLVRSRIRGLEWQVQSNPVPQKLYLQLSYTYLDAVKLGKLHTVFTLDDPFYQPTRALPYRPRHLIQGGIRLKWHALTTGIDFRYLSRFEEVLVYPWDHRVPQKVLDAYAVFRLSRKHEFSFRANNLLNYNYVEVERNLAPIRHFIFTLTSSF